MKRARIVVLIAIVLAAVTASSVAASGRVASAHPERSSNPTAFDSAVAVAPSSVVTLHQDPTQRRVTDDPGVYSSGFAQAADTASTGVPATTALSNITSSNGGSDTQSADQADGGPDGADDHKKVNWHRKYCDKTRDDLVKSGPEAEEALEGLCDPGACGELPGLPDGVDVLAATPRPGWSNIFNFDGTTVYFFYVDVLLSQDGITSARTIEIPMTLESGAWTPSDIDIQTDGLDFVQSVEF